MTAEAPSAVSAGESPQSVLDSELPRRPLLPSQGGSGSFPFPPNGVQPDGVSPDGDGAPADPPAAVDAAEVDAAQDELVEVDTAQAEPVEADTVEADFDGAEAIEAEFAPNGTVEPDFVRAETFELGTAGPDAYPAGTEATGSDPDAEPVMVETATVEAVLADPVDLTDDPDLATEAVAHEVADQLGSVVGEDVEADPAEFAAAAVLDVLRAAGWADAAEAAELRAEATRTRELLSEVIRDHRAREASAAGGHNQQLYWLIPLLRAAHGVAFGSLGAKVALRTAVQEVPPDVLASAGLRIDYGVEPAYED